MTNGENTHGFIRRHWLGEYSFPRSFWFHTTVLAWLAPIATLTVLSSNAWNIQGRTASGAFLAILLVFYPALFWGICGTARAAKHYLNTGGTRIWVQAASWVIALLFMDSIYFVLGTRAIVVDHIRMAFTGRYGPPASITVSKDGRRLFLTGELREGTAEAISIAMAHASTVAMVTLDSKGGLFQEASRVAEIISQHHLDTYVERECSSACTLLFLAGNRRCMAEDARIGFHAASYARDLSRRTPEAIAEFQREQYTTAGLSQSFVNRIIKTPNRSVWYPSQQELLEAHVTTRDCI